MSNAQADRLAELKQNVYHTKLIITPPEGAGEELVLRGIVPLSLEHREDLSDPEFRAEFLELVIEGIGAVIESINQSTKERENA